jgi:uncharacterized cupredoxin-like copper-binding protein
VAALASGCSGSGAGTRAVVRVTERDFAIRAPRVLSAHDVRLSVRNDGPDTHELLVARLGDHPLPLRRDGLTVDEDGLGKALVGAVEGGKPKTVQTVVLHLSPGRYVLFCNMSGHYMGGMHRELVVR